MSRDGQTPSGHPGGTPGGCAHVPAPAGPAPSSQPGAPSQLAASLHDPDRSHRSNRSSHRGDAYHVAALGPGGSLRGGTAFRVEEGPRDALAGAPCLARVRAYLRKAKGGLDSALPLPAPLDAAISTLGAFLGILAVAGIDSAIR